MSRQPPEGHPELQRVTEATLTSQAVTAQRGPRSDTLLLALIAGASLTIVRFEASMTPWFLAIRVSIEFAAGIALWFAFRKGLKPSQNPWFYVGAALATAAIYPALYEYVLRLFGGGAEPLEIGSLNSLLLFSIVLAAFSQLPRMSGTSALLSASTVLFSTTISQDRWVAILAAAYGVIGLWWLMGNQWERLESTFIPSTVQRKLPIRVSFVIGTAVVAVAVAATLATNGNSAISLRGFMPTSGGNRWHDPQARSGVGDGDALVAAKDQALSFGPIESELFLDSEMPSLYDIFSEEYGEPRKLQKEQERSIALSPENQKEVDQQVAESQRSGREFSALRHAVRKRDRLDDRDAPAMLYVVGETPVHLALEAYDYFDGAKWQQETAWSEPHELTLEHRNKQPWVRFRQEGGASIFRGEARHALKIINLKESRIPTPPCFSAAHIDRLDRLDFFGWTPDGMVELTDRKYVPQLTVIHLRSKQLNLMPLREGMEPPSSPALEPYLEVQNAAAAEIAQRWSKGLPPGWRQVEAVVARLRSEFQHDPSAVAPDDCSDVVTWFLDSGRGPDYLFASTAAVMLRSLGYPTRFVSGFYADGERYDYRAGQTPVLAEDVHVWAEVCVDGQNWVAVEPTPGYAPPRETLTFAEWMTVSLQRTARAIRTHWMSIALASSIIVLCILARATLLDVLATVLCGLLGFVSPSSRLLWTIRLLEWRAWLAGRCRPPQSTLPSWYRPLGSASGAAAPHLEDFFRCTDQLLYSPTGSHVDLDMQRRACRAVSGISRRQIRSQLPPGMSTTHG